MLHDEVCDVSHYVCSPEQYRPMTKHNAMSCFLPTSTPMPAKAPVLSKNICSRVLISAENLKRIEEKEREKERKAQESKSVPRRERVRDGCIMILQQNLSLRWNHLPKKQARVRGRGRGQARGRGVGRGRKSTPSSHIGIYTCKL